VQRPRSTWRDPRLVALVLGVVLIVAGIAWAVTRGSASEQEQAQEALSEGLDAHARGDLEAAEEAYLRTIELDPQNKFAYYNLGVIKQGRDDLAGAESEYRSAVAIDPDFVPALFNLAILRTQAGQEAEAVGLYEHIIEVDPQHAAAHLNLGFLLIERGDEERGRDELDEAVRLDPGLEDRIDPGLFEDEPVGETGGEGPSS
jgi:tetratricopeptide (TPR) repeat protein